ncbi:hypothetical protein BJP62_11320 [Jeongeupia sp. USM3]|nr:hypothetical protein BJP62_11320 [Jeongeupia sp. USM3]
MSAHAETYSDVYSGTIKLEGKEIILTRCDLAKNKYVLTSKNKNGVLNELPPEIRTNGIVSADVIAEYKSKSGRNYLDVIELRSVQTGKSCHLLDLL